MEQRGFLQKRIKSTPLNPPNQNGICSNTANYFSAKNKLAATLQTTFQSKTNLQQHCKLLFSQKQACSSAANHMSMESNIYFSIKTRSMSCFIDHPTISFQISSETRLARRCMQGLSIHIKKSAIPYLYLSF